MIQRIAVMGAGSLGTILGAYLSKAGRDVVLIDAYQAHVDALNQNGAHITGAVEMTVPVKAITPEQMEGQYDLFFYLAKQTYNDVAIPQMMAHMGEGSVICTGQNGLPERAVSKAVGVHRTLGSPVGWGAPFMGPGCSILEDMCPVHVSENLMGYRWTKLLVNCTFSGLSASFGCTFGDVLDDPRAVRLAVKLGAECIAVAKGCGVRMEPHSLAGDLDQVFVWGDEDTIAGSVAAVRKGWEPHRKLVASMAQDLAHGRKCEIDAVASESGVDAHVPTPINDMVVHVVKGIQDGKWKGSFDNLKFFEGLY